MNKTIVRSETEFVSMFSEMDTNELEEFLSIEFAYVDGKYQSDLDSDPTIDEGQDLSRDKYRKSSDETFPSAYPCVVVWENKLSHDRFGSVRIVRLEFVYQSDFQ